LEAKILLLLNTERCKEEDNKKLTKFGRAIERIYFRKLEDSVEDVEQK
jgi:hypothetical protein